MKLHDEPTWAVRRRIGSNKGPSGTPITYEVLSKRDMALLVAYRYTVEHKEAFGERKGKLQVTRIYDDAGSLEGFKTRRNKYSPWISYLVEECNIVLY